MQIVCTGLFCHKICATPPLHQAANSQRVLSATSIAGTSPTTALAAALCLVIFSWALELAHLCRRAYPLLSPDH